MQPVANSALPIALLAISSDPIAEVAIASASMAPVANDAAVIPPGLMAATVRVFVTVATVSYVALK